MIEHVVKQGECVTSIAAANGTLCKKVWNSEENEDLHEERKSPDVLFPGDVVRIDDKDRGEQEKGAEQRHRFRRKQDKVFLRLKLLDMGEARAGESYEIRIAGQVLKGKTDGEGRIEERIPPDAEEAVLRLGGDEGAEDYILKLGELDPVTEPSGVQARLGHLGYDCEVTGTIDAQTSRALREFQHDQELAVSGEADEGTRDKLVEVHGS